METRYGFIITHAWSHDEDMLTKLAIPILGPGNLDSHVKKMLLSGEGETFQLYDDDHNLCLQGSGLGCAGVEPLIHYGAGAWGCTYIQWL